MAATWPLRPGSDARMPLLAWIVLAAVALLTLWPGQTTIPVMDRDEARYAQAARQMLETGDFVDIRFQDQARLVKPAGIYWLQAASAAGFGGASASINAHRLPSLAGAVVAVLATAWLGARMAGAHVGFVAGVLLALSLVMSVEARTAKTDAVLLAVVTIAQAALFVLSQRAAADRSRFFGAPLVFWVASGAAVMIKGPVGPLVTGTTIAALALWRRRVGWLRHLRPVAGLLVLVVIAAPWIIAITLKTDGAFLREWLGHSVMGKVAQSDDSHGAPPGYYTLLLTLTFWPGVLLVGLGAVAAWRRRQEPAVRFLIAWMVPTWVVFEVAVTKLPHYTLPVFPAIAILAAIGLREAGTLLQSKTARRLHWVTVVLFAVAGVALALVPPAAGVVLDGTLSPAAVAATVFGLAAVAAGLWLARAPAERSLLPLAAATVAFYALTFHVVIPGVAALWPSARIGEAVRALEGCDTVAVATAGYREPSNVFVLGTATTLGSGREAADLLLAQPACAVVAVDASERDAFRHRMEENDAGWRTLGRIEGMNYSKGDPLALEIHISEASRLRPSPDSDGYVAR